jgi:hypothetical protein
VVRGGSWNNNENNARAAYRNRNNPDNYNNNVGFRVVFSHNFLFTGNACCLYVLNKTAAEVFWKLAQSIPGG